MSKLWDQHLSTHLCVPLRHIARMPEVRHVAVSVVDDDVILEVDLALLSQRRDLIKTLDDHATQLLGVAVIDDVARELVFNALNVLQQKQVTSLTMSLASSSSMRSMS